MAKRSLSASPTGARKAKQAFQRKGWTQEYLAAEVGLSTRQSIWKFFTGRPIERQLFVTICSTLELDWEEIVDLPKNADPQRPASDANDRLEVESLVRQLRSQRFDRIQTQCGTLQSSFDLTQPLQLEQVYIHVNILPHLTNQRWLEVSDLQTNRPSSARFDLTEGPEKTVPAMPVVTANPKLVILGKPGAGKTTFLQQLALQCNRGTFKADCFPIFIVLRNFIAEAIAADDFSLVNYINRHVDGCGISREQLELLLHKGKALLLLDGLDEVPGDRLDALLKQIDKFSETYYRNQIAIACRNAALNYHFRGFAYIEIADFNPEQIEEFAEKWFVANPKNSRAKGLELAAKFIDRLQRTENQPIRELGVTPILLNLICSVFQDRESFPTKRAKLYQTGLDILLVRWDNARGIQRDAIYRNLSLADKIKLLSQIAEKTFEQTHYFFEKRDVLQIVENYLVALHKANTDPETLWLNSEAVLKAIELQHGLLVERARDIYSFSHLTFQEYLTARKIVASPDSHSLERALKKLATRVTDVRWREVILLTASLLPQADFLLQRMQREIASLVGKEPKLQTFLTRIHKKVSAMSLSYNTAAVRAFYFTLFQNRDLKLALSVDVKLARDPCPELALDLALARTFAIGLTLVENPDIKQILNLSFALEFDRSFQLEPVFKQVMEQLKQQLPDPAGGRDSLRSWWKTNGKNWVEQFRSAAIEHRQIADDWQLSLEQQELWERYYNANQFLVECLNSDCQVSEEVRSQLEAALLLPNPTDNLQYPTQSQTDCRSDC